MPKLYFGSRGGVYYKRKGRKVYVNRFGSDELPDFVKEKCKKLGIDCNQFKGVVSINTNWKFNDVDEFFDAIKFINDNPELKIKKPTWEIYKGPGYYSSYIKLAKKHKKFFPAEPFFPFGTEGWMNYEYYLEYLEKFKDWEQVFKGVKAPKKDKLIWDDEIYWKSKIGELERDIENKKTYDKILKNWQDWVDDFVDVRADILNKPEWNPNVDWEGYEYYLLVYTKAKELDIEIDKWESTDKYTEWRYIREKLRKYNTAKKLSEQYGITLPIEVEKPFRGNQDFDTVINWLKYAKLAKEYNDVIEDYNKIKRSTLTEKIKNYEEWIKQDKVYKKNILRCLETGYDHCIDEPDFYGCIKIEEDKDNKKKNCIYKAAMKGVGLYGFNVYSEEPPEKFLLDDNCGLCLEPLKNGQALCRRYQCDHLFHCKCIIPWINEHVYQKSQCPLCKAEDFGKTLSSFGRWYTSSSVPFGVDIKVGDVVEVGKNKRMKKSVPPSVRLKKGHRKVVCEFGFGGTIKKGSRFIVDGVTSNGSFVRAKMI